MFQILTRNQPSSAQRIDAILAKYRALMAKPEKTERDGWELLDLLQQYGDVLKDLEENLPPYGYSILFTDGEV